MVVLTLDSSPIGYLPLMGQSHARYNIYEGFFFGTIFSYHCILKWSKVIMYESDSSNHYFTLRQLKELTKFKEILINLHNCKKMTLENNCKFICNILKFINLNISRKWGYFVLDATYD